MSNQAKERHIRITAAECQAVATLAEHLSRLAGDLSMPELPRGRRMLIAREVGSQAAALARAARDWAARTPPAVAKTWVEEGE